MMVRIVKIHVFVLLASLSVACGDDESSSAGGGDASQAGGAAGSTGNSGNTPVNQDITATTNNPNNNNNNSGTTNIDEPPQLLPPTALVQNLAFTDSDTSYAEIQGTLSADMASDESEISYYVLYWGSDATTKLDGNIVQSVVSGANVSIDFSADSPIPAGATHFLIYSGNAAGESTSPSALAITELVHSSNPIANGASDWDWEQSGASYDSGDFNSVVLDSANSTAIGLLFENVVIPANAQVSTAYMKFHYRALSPLSADISAHAVSNASACTSAGDCDTALANATSASVTTPNFDVSNSTASPQTTAFNAELKPVVDEVIGLAGWNSGQNMLFFLSDLSGSGTTEITSYESGLSTKTELVIVYTRTL